MPLPSPKTEWPPSFMTEPRRYQETARTWYRGDLSALAKHYGDGKDPGGGRVGFWAKQWGRFTGKASTVLDGRQASSSDERGMHIPLATDLAVAYGRMLMNESLSYSWGETATTISERWAVIAKGNAWEARLNEAAERAGGLGDIFLRATWDTRVAPHALISVIDPGRVVPFFAHGRLIGAWLVEEYASAAIGSQIVWRHLECHEDGRVVHLLFEGTTTSLGDLRPLSDHASTEGYFSIVNADSAIETGYDGLAVVHVPAMRPSRALSGHPLADDLGRAVTAGIEGNLDAADRAWSSLIWDLEAAKTRLFVAQHLLAQGAGLAHLSTERGVYPVAHVPGQNETAMPILAQQFLIRVTEHLAIIEANVRQVISSAGFSPQTFGLSDGGGGETATAVHARTSLTRETYEAATRYWQPPLEHIIEAALAIDARHCNGPGVARPTVGFPAFSSPTLLDLATTIQVLRQAEVASIETGVRMAHPDWTDIQVGAERDQILVESGRSVPSIEDEA